MTRVEVVDSRIDGSELVIGTGFVNGSSVSKSNIIALTSDFSVS